MKNLVDLLQQSEREADFAPTVKLAESIMQKKAPINTHVQVHFESKKKKKTHKDLKSKDTHAEEPEQSV